MRWMIAILVVVKLIIVDQFRFRGYYGSELYRAISTAITAVTR